MFFQKSIYDALIILFLFYSCAPKPISKVPETAIKDPIIIDFIPSNNSILSEITRIKVDINIDKIKKISFFLNDTLVHQDNKYPYYYDWNTSSYLDNSEHSIYVNITVEDDTIIKSKLQNYVIDNSDFRPNPPNLITVDYTNKEMKMKASQLKEQGNGEYIEEARQILKPFDVSLFLVHSR